MKKVTPRTIRSFKGTQKFACLTAYDAQTSRLFEEAEIPLILVGDSVGTTHMGFKSTIPVTISENPGLGAASFTVSYDKTVLTLDSIEKGAVLSTGSFSPSLNTNAVQEIRPAQIQTSREIVSVIGAASAFRMSFMDRASFFLVY